MIPPALPPTHAWVVEARPLDGCAPPSCRIEGRSATGSVAAGGGYALVGSEKHELFARRAKALAPGESMVFTLAAREGESALDLDASSLAPGGGAYRVAISVTPAGGEPLLSTALAGTTAAWVPRVEPDELGHEEAFFGHARVPLPSRSGRAIEVRLRNDADTAVAIGAPTVVARVDGRAPRQLVFFVFDAVPWPAMQALLRGTGDPSTAWLGAWVRTGSLFERGVSPGQLTGSFVRRFFQARYFRLDGDPSLAGQGFDEAVPERATGPIARLVEQGFATAEIGSNLYLSPVLSRLGFDASYDVEPIDELQIHPPVVARVAERFLERHAADDAALVVWVSSTHAPWRDVRADAAPLEVAGLGDDALDRGVLEPIHRNLLDASGALHALHAAAARVAPTAERVWLVATDHGHTFTREARGRPWRLTTSLFESGHMHCCLATQQEARTPFALVREGPGGAPASTAGLVASSGVVAEPTSAMVAWRAVERAFGVSLDLPATSSFDRPDGAAGDSFADDALVSVGDSGALAAVHGTLAYRSYRGAPGLRSAVGLSAPMANLLRGSPKPEGGLYGEELYDLASDPYELVNVASTRMLDLLDMRRRVTTFLSVHGDSPARPRHRYVLAFAAEADLELDAPRELALGVGADDPTPSPRARKLRASRLTLDDRDEPIGAIDLHGAAIAGGLLVRCAASGLPLAVLDAAHPRLDLVVARTNCPGAAPNAPVLPREIAFGATLLSSRAEKAERGPARPELEQALRRWGYVR